jgi:hypothetical protein
VTVTTRRISFDRSGTPSKTVRNQRSARCAELLTIVFLLGLMAPAAAQKVAIEAANAKWMEFFNKGDFDGVASLYTTDATAFPPGSAMVRGRAAIGAM